MKDYQKDFLVKNEISLNEIEKLNSILKKGCLKDAIDVYTDELQLMILNDFGVRKEDLCSLIQAMEQGDSVTVSKILLANQIDRYFTPEEILLSIGDGCFANLYNRARKSLIQTKIINDHSGRVKRFLERFKPHKLIKENN